MKLLKRVRRVLESALVLFARGSIPLLSRLAVLRLSGFLGICAYSFSPSLRRVSLANLKIAFGDSLSEPEMRVISKASFQHFCLSLLDLFWFNRNTPERMKLYFRYDSSFEAVFDGTPNILISGHLGNWEVMGLGCGQRGLPVTAVVMPSKNAFAESELARLRKHSGYTFVPREGALRHIMKALKQGGSTALLVDQNTLPDEGGMFVPFFGLPVPVTKAVGALWARTQARPVVVWCTVDAAGVYTAYAKPPVVTAEEDVSVETVTLRVTQELEGVIRDNPEHWLWSYKRWRFYRAEDSVDAFPFYAESLEQCMTFKTLVQRHQASVRAKRL
jgi:KDO2-lipid IV(A) lauroyltransferase